jgi:hypothetical protein
MIKKKSRQRKCYTISKEENLWQRLNSSWTTWCLVGEGHKEKVGPGKNVKRTIFTYAFLSGMHDHQFPSNDQIKE